MLRVTLREKSIVEVYPDIDAFHDALIDELAKAFADEIADGRAGELPTGFDDWVVGVYINGKIMMTSPNNPGSVHNYESLVTVVVHEFVHLVTAQINADAPSILNEGIAVTLADQPVNIKDTLGAAIKNGSFPAVSELESLPASDLYPYGRALVEFIISEYGNDTLMELYKNPDFQVVFGISEDEFREKWMEFITEEYRDKSIPESILPNNNP